MSWFKKPQLSVGATLCIFATAIFWLAAIGWFQDRSATEMARWVLEYLGISASWTSAVSGWIEERKDFVLTVSTLMLFGGVFAVSASEPRLLLGQAPGAYTALAAFALGLEAGAGMIGLLSVAVGGLGLGVFIARMQKIGPKEAGIGAGAELLAAAFTPALLIMVFFVRSPR